MTVLYLDLFSGASGDMLLGALLDAGLPLADLQQALRSLPIHGWEVHAEPEERQAIRGTRAIVRYDEAHQPHRHLADILAVIEAGAPPQGLNSERQPSFGGWPGPRATCTAPRPKRCIFTKWAPSTA